MVQYLHFRYLKFLVSWMQGSRLFKLEGNMHLEEPKWMFPKIRVPQDGWFIMEKPIILMDLGVPLFLETPKYQNPCCFFSKKMPFIHCESSTQQRWVVFFLKKKTSFSYSTKTPLIFPSTIHPSIKIFFKGCRAFFRSSWLAGWCYWLAPPSTLTLFSITDANQELKFMDSSRLFAQLLLMV